MRILDERRGWMSDELDLEWFLEVLDEERDRIWRMEDSFKPHFDLVMDIKLNLL